MAQVSRRAGFDAMLHAATTEVNGDGDAASTGIRVRLPRLFDDKGQSLAAANNRAQPPMGAIPGLSYAMERMLDDAAGKFAPAYCYFAAVSKATTKPEDLQKQITGIFKAPLTQQAVESPAGGSKSVMFLTLTGTQDFDGAQSQLPLEKLDGQLDLYLIDTPTHIGILAFRCPKGQADKYQFFQAARASAGSFEVSAAAPPPAAAPAAPADGSAPAAAPGAAPAGVDPAAAGTAPAAAVP